MIVNSSHGALVIDTHGDVVVEDSQYDDDELKGMAKFDLKEWEAA